MMNLGYPTITKDEDYITPMGEPKIIGWYRWPDRWSHWGKYHAFLLNNPKNTKIKTLFGDKITVWSACDQNGTDINADFTHTPTIDKCCKNCLKELKKVTE